MKIKMFTMYELQERLEKENPLLSEDSEVVLGLGNLKGFATDEDNEYVFFLNNQENYKKIQSIYPQYYEYITKDLTDIDVFVQAFDGGEYYKSETDITIEIGECIDLLLSNIECDEEFETARVLQCFNKELGSGSFNDMISFLIQKQVADVLEYKANLIREESESVKKNGCKWS